MIQLTDDQQKALDAMMSGKNVFLTGEAGTGKSTVLREFRERCDRACVVLAPTGVAAINAGGSTIHSFFLLKPGLMTPDTIEDIEIGKKRAVIRAAKTIIIDEISMVRSDVFVAIDIRLRSLAKGGNKNKPFGGKQIILVGDFFQLPPVVKTETESNYLNQKLGGGYAFQTDLWQDAKFKCIFLRVIHRQKNDARFVSILNSIRHGELDMKSIEGDDGEKITATEALNRYCLNRERLPSEPVSLCTTNREAHTINTMARARLKEAGAKFNAVVTGRFPEGDFPTEAQLELMKGARVMILRNSRTPDGNFEYVNGDMGSVTAISETGENPWVKIRLDRDGKEVSVACHEWKNYTYVIEEDKVSGRKVLRQREIGKFTQVPLRLAYAITIHKSQGLSLDCVDLKLGSGCFSHGQLYTALSRCRSLDGLRLDRSVMKEDLILDDAVVEFYRAIETGREAPPSTVSLKVPPQFEAAMRAYLRQLQAGGKPEGGLLPLEHPIGASCPSKPKDATRRNQAAPPSILDPQWDILGAKGDGCTRIHDHIDLKKLIVVYNGQTCAEKYDGETKRENGVGFNKFDAPVLTPIAEEYLAQGWVTEDELQMVSFRIQKYRRQWEGRV